MQNFELNAEPRSNVGKGASRRLRRTGKVPGVLYGTEKEPVSIQMDHDDLVHHLENEAFYSHILTLKLGTEVQEVVLRDLQRHPYKPKLMHIDLQRISASEKITMRVPIHIINAAVCPGVKDEKGIVNSLMSQLEVICLPRNLPEYIEIDIAALHVGQSFHLSDLSCLKVSNWNCWFQVAMQIRPFVQSNRHRLKKLRNLLRWVMPLRQPLLQLTRARPADNYVLTGLLCQHH